MTTMITLETLATLKEEALKEVEAVEAKQKLAIQERTDRYKEVIDEVFEGVFKESDTVNVSSSTWNRSIDVSVCRGGKYDEILRFNFRTSSYVDSPFDKIETGFYSTSASSEFELERMITIGKVGSVLLNRGDELCRLFNEVADSYKATLTAIERELSSANVNLREILQEETKLRKEALMTKLEIEGIKFEYDEQSWKNPSFDIKFNWKVNNVTKVKLLETTPSGKSARLEITRMTWDQDFNRVEDTFEETVRMDKLEYFLSQNKASMINN